MGAGKSCIGRRLAQRLGEPFTDADGEIERAAGLTIAEIFAKYGEVEFRKLEGRVMARLLQGSPGVLSAGGGAFMDPDTRALIKQRGISIWLRADLDTLVSRTKGRTHRPLLNSGDPRQTLAEMIEVRYPVYAEADIIVDTGLDNPNVTGNRVNAALDAFLAQPRPAASHRQDRSRDRQRRTPRPAAAATATAPMGQPCASTWARAAMTSMWVAACWPSGPAH